MTAQRQRPDVPLTPERLALLARKALQADEARIAMAEYQRDHIAAVDRMAKLKALRLAQEALPVEVKPKAKRTKKVLPALNAQ